MVTQIYVVMHKLMMLSLRDDIYKCILVGNAVNDEMDESYIKDNSGDNISEKNHYYCELTALYWIWKNANSDIAGLVHYRRFFCQFPWVFKSNILCKKKIEKMFSKGADILVPFAYNGRSNKYKNNFERYKNEHIISDLDCARDVVRTIYPEYIDAFDKVMRSNKLYLFNMFIAKKEVVDEYCKWLFNILSLVECKIDYKNRDTYQQRVFGFLSERLFNVWLFKNESKYKISELNYFMTSESLITRTYRSFKYITNYIMRNNNGKRKSDSSERNLHVL